MATPEGLIADQFNAYFAHFDIRIGPDEVVAGTRREIRERGWRILLKIVPDDSGLPSLEFYATHRMTNDRHARIWADGHLEHLDAIEELYAYDPNVPGAKEAAHEAYLMHNRRVAEQLRASGLYPEGDINAYLRTAQDEGDSTKEHG
jgi:hypothetical protein